MYWVAWRDGDLLHRTARYSNGLTEELDGYGLRIDGREWSLDFVAITEH